jgi:protein involved in polysaccharide export with SLBB domain
MRGRWPAIAALALLLSGCSAAGPDLAVPTSSVNENSFATAPDTPNMSDLKLQAGDKVHVTVYGEKDLTGDYQVNSGGYVALPLAGSVKALGLTPPDLEKALEKQFTKLRDPRVTVEVISSRPFYVMGRFKNRANIPTAPD